MGSPWEFRADVKSGATWFTLGDITDVSIFRGRRLQVDDYSVDSCTITALYPASWTTAPKLGDQISVYVHRPGPVPGHDDWSMFIGRIRDVRIDYGFVTNADIATIECEGLQADWGRAQLNSKVLTQKLTGEQALDVAITAGLSFSSFYSRSTASGQTYTGNAWELLNDLVRTEEARLFSRLYDPLDMRSAFYMLFYGRNRQLDPSAQPFNDGTYTANFWDGKYDAIEFRSSADNYYNQVTITPLSVAAQTATLAATPIFAWQKDTLDFSTSQASDHALWTLNNYQTKNSTLASISALDREQGLTPTGGENITLLSSAENAIGTRFAVGFRGTQYQVICEGVQITADPNQTRVTFYFSGADTNSYLVLDNAVFGKLDQNKLGF